MRFAQSRVTAIPKWNKTGLKSDMWNWGLKHLLDVVDFFSFNAEYNKIVNVDCNDHIFFCKHAKICV